MGEYNNQKAQESISPSVQDKCTIPDQPNMCVYSDPLMRGVLLRQFDGEGCIEAHNMGNMQKPTVDPKDSLS